MKYFGITDRGKLRRTNQDNYVIASNASGDVFAIVCDGIGGGKGGDVASRLAVSHFSMAFSLADSFENETEVRRWLSLEIPAANTEIYETGIHTPGLKGMGTTMTGVLISRAGRFVLNIGDSRTYAYYKDHSILRLDRPSKPSLSNVQGTAVFQPTLLSMTVTTCQYFLSK